MGIILGFLCLLFFCVLSAKAITRIFHWKKADRFLMKIHKGVSLLMLAGVILHVIFVLPVLKNRHIFVIITGIAAIIFLIFLICSCHMIKDRKKRLLWHRILAAAMAVSIVAHIVVYTVDFNTYQKKIQNIVVDDIDVTGIADGTYEGACDVGYIYARVRVEVKDGRIITVELLEHRNERGQRAEQITEDVVSQQKINVDTISGATNSSKVIRKAIENAVTSNK